MRIQSAPVAGSMLRAAGGDRRLPFVREGEAGPGGCRARGVGAQRVPEKALRARHKESAFAAGQRGDRADLDRGGVRDQLAALVLENGERVTNQRDRGFAVQLQGEHRGGAGRALDREGLKQALGALVQTVVGGDPKTGQRARALLFGLPDRARVREQGTLGHEQSIQHKEPGLRREPGAAVRAGLDALDSAHHGWVALVDEQRPVHKLARFDLKGLTADHRQDVAATGDAQALHFAFSGQRALGGEAPGLTRPADDRGALLVGVRCFLTAAARQGERSGEA